jgi:hypothetical protein
VKPYSLGYVQGYIVCQGPESILRSLSHVPGAAALSEGLLSFPASRTAFMASEAVASPTTASREYLQARATFMNSPVIPVKTRLEEAVKPLLDHQWQFLGFAEGKRAVLNASEQGTGKTRSAWALWKLWAPERTLIVCPKSLVNQWAAEYEAMWRVRPCALLAPLGEGSGRDRSERIGELTRNAAISGNRQVVIVNYEMLVTLLPAILKWAPDMLIYDESWRIKNRSAAVTKAALKLGKKLSPRTLLLTGTPIGNGVGDLWSQLRLLGEDVMPDPFLIFQKAYADLYPMNLGSRVVWKEKGIADPVGLMQVLEPVWYRATKELCLTLPPKVRHKVRLRLPGETQAIYDRVKNNGSAELGCPLNLDGETVTMIRLQQLAGGHLPVPLDDRGREWTMQQLPCPKLEWLETFARDQLLGNPSARCIVWCRFLPEVERVHDALRQVLGLRVAAVWGQTSNDLLEDYKASFNSRVEDGVQVIVAQISKLAYGHNLQSCDYSIHFSHTWSYVERAQAEDRAHRHGREGAVQYFDLVAEKTIDEQIMAAMARKEDLSVRVSPDTIG